MSGSTPGPAPWLGIQIRHLAALEAVAEEGSFNRAAKRLGYTQSAISQQVAALEKIVGERLFVRPERSKPVTPTPAGEVVLAQARGILARLRVAHGEVRALREGTSRNVRVGLFHGLGNLIAPALVEHFPLNDPHVLLRLVHASSDAELIGPLSRGEIDLAFVAMPLEPGPLVGEELVRDEFHLVASHDHPLVHEPKLEPAQLNGVPVVCLRRCRATTTALARLESQDVRPDLAYRSDDVGMLLGLVRSGAATALLPALSIDANMRDLVVRSFDAGALHRRIGVAWRRDHPPTGIGAEFVDVVRKALARTDAVVAEAS